MRKLLVVLLTVALIFAFAACEQQTAPAEEPVAEEGLTAIPLGGGLGELDVSAFGAYVPAEFHDKYIPAEGETGQLYYAEGSDVPYIAVYRCAKDGRTLEEITAATAEKLGGFSYQIVPWRALNIENCGYFIISEYNEDAFTYAEGNIIEDGDDFVGVYYFSAVEEIALGDSGLYIWLPAGYSDETDEIDLADGCVLDAVYADSYDFANVWIEKTDHNYDSLTRFWSDDFPEGLPFDEATYNGWMEQGVSEGWTEVNQIYYGALGFTDSGSLQNEVNGIAYTVVWGYLNDCFIADTYISAGEDTYLISACSGIDPELRCAKAIAMSLHSK